MPIDHWMTFATFNEQRYFSYPRENSYKGVIFNANIVAHAPEGIAAFLMSKTEGLQYLIDPLTHAFQHEPSAIRNKSHELKSSIARLADYYGPPVQAIAGQRPMIPNDFVPPGIIEGFVEKCFAFQRDGLSSKMADSEWNQYLLQDQRDLGPYALVAPYVYLTETNYHRWLPIALRLSGAALAKRGNAKLFLPIVLSRGALLDAQVRSSVILQLGRAELDGYLLWIDDLDETKAAGGTLTAFLDLARKLRKREDQEIINLHGGYFSVLAAGKLGNSALTGVSHGPEFGEHRGVVPVGGGIPRPKFYLPRLHARIPYKEAQSYLSDLGWLEDTSKFFSNVCDCAECQQVLAAGVGNFTSYGDATVKLVKRDRGFTRMEFPTSVAKQQCLRHYLQRKAIEFNFSATAESSEILAELQKGYTIFRDVAPETAGHLSIWAKALTGKDLDSGEGG